MFTLKPPMLSGDPARDLAALRDWAWQLSRSLEDVTTAGTSINETVPILKAAGDVTIAGLCVSVDRQERGSGEKSALREISAKYGFPTRAIVTMSEVCEYLEGAGSKSGIMTPELKASIDAYYAQYGARD